MTTLLISDTAAYVKVRRVYIICVKELRMTEQISRSAAWKLPVFLVLGAVVVLTMLRLGIWQLGRADEKQRILDEQVSRSSQLPVALSSLDPTADDLRFRKVTLQGTLLADKTIFVDRQVVGGQVGYQVFTPLQTTDGFATVLVARGWVAVGDSREVLPFINTPDDVLSLTGRLNLPPAQPPLWSEEYAVVNGAVWQYLPIEEYASQMRLKLFPLVVELAPETSSPAALLIDWPAIDDQWVAKHKGYAFQWFAMAIAFFVACLVLLIRRSTKP